MTTKSILLGAIAALGLSLGAGAFDTADAGGGDRVRFRCKVRADGDVSMHAKYEERVGRGRRKFSVEAEAGPTGGSGIVAGKIMTVAVDGRAAGTQAFESVVGGDVVADLNLDSRPQADSKPFPAGLVVRRGSEVEISVNTKPPLTLACELN